MSYLKQLTGADAHMRATGAGPCMHIRVGYSMAAKLAALADIGEKFKGWSVKTESDRYVIRSPAGEESEVFFLGYSDDHCDTGLLRELGQVLDEAGCDSRNVAFPGYSASRISTFWKDKTAWELTTAAGNCFVAEDSDLSEMANLTRDIVASMGHDVERPVGE